LPWSWVLELRAFDSADGHELGDEVGVGARQEVVIIPGIQGVHDLLAVGA
jgi:hypothetical protein